MIPSYLPEAEEARAIYRQGEEAVVQVIVQLVTLVRQLEARIEEQRARIQELEDRLARNSQNSSKPPSSDGYRKPAPRSMRHRSGKKAGGQEGHKGIRLEPVSRPDHTVVHRVKHCQRCGMELAAVPAEKVEKRQVFDLPEEVRLEVTEHQAEIKTCPQCGTRNQAEFPSGVSQETQYGPRVQAQMVYFNVYHFIPFERTAEVIEDLYQQPVSAGTVAAVSVRAAEQVKPVNEQVRRYLTQTAQAVHFDETGLRAAGKLHWLHSVSTERATLYQTHAKRGEAALQEIGILPQRTGWSIHDFWKPYLQYTQAQHGICNAHLLRELTFVVEQYHQSWAAEMRELLLKIKQTVETAKAAGQTALSPPQQQAFRSEYDRLVQQGLESNPAPVRTEGQRGRVKQGPPRNLLERLRDHPEKVLAFMYDFDVPFDNNLSERDLRMAKVKQKVSGGFRSLEGANVFCQVRSYLSTARKNNQRILDALYQALTGSPFMPAFVSSMAE